MLGYNQNRRLWNKMLSEKKLQYQGRTTIIAVGGAKSIKWDMNPPITCYFIMALLVLFQLRVGVNIHQWVLCIVLTDQSWSWKQIIQAGDVIKIYHVLKLLPVKISGVPPPWNCLIMTTRQYSRLAQVIHTVINRGSKAKKGIKREGEF